MSSTIFIATIEADTKEVFAAFATREKAAEALADHMVEFLGITPDEELRGRMVGELSLGYSFSYDVYTLEVEECSFYA